MASLRSSLRNALAAAVVCAVAATSVHTAAAAASERDQVALAEALARRTWHEGVPAEEALALGDAGVRHLLELLADPSEADHHAQVIEVLGLSGHRDAYAAVSAAAAEPPEGDLDRAALRKRVAILVALGHLARGDDRALRDLETAARRDSETALGFRRAGSSERETARLMRRSAVSALALSGRAEARKSLQRLEREAVSDPDFAAHVRGALREHALGPRVGRPGAEAPPGSER